MHFNCKEDGETKDNISFFLGTVKLVVSLANKRQWNEVELVSIEETGDRIILESYIKTLSEQSERLFARDSTLPEDYGTRVFVERLVYYPNFRVYIGQKVSEKLDQINKMPCDVELLPLHYWWGNYKNGAKKA